MKSTAITYILAVLLDAQNLSAELACSLKARIGGDTITKDKTLTSLHILVAQGTVLFLKGGLRCE